MKTTGFPELKYYFHVSQTELKIDNFKMVYNEKWVLDLMHYPNQAWSHHLR